MIINFSIRYKSNNYLKVMSSFLTVGYAVPGLILAIGVMQMLTYFDQSFISEISNFVLTGSVIGLVLAYVIKSLSLIHI